MSLTGFPNGTTSCAQPGDPLIGTNQRTNRRRGTDWAGGVESNILTCTLAAQTCSSLLIGIALPRGAESPNHAIREIPLIAHRSLAFSVGRILLFGLAIGGYHMLY